MSTFGNRLRDARRSKNLTQEDLAEAMKLSQAAISQFEKDQRVPTPSTIEKLAKCLGTDTASLAGQDDTEFQSNILMRNLRGLSPETVRKINEIVETYKKAEAR